MRSEAQGPAPYVHGGWDGLGREAQDQPCGWAGGSVGWEALGPAVWGVWGGWEGQSVGPTSAQCSPGLEPGVEPGVVRSKGNWE